MNEEILLKTLQDAGLDEKGIVDLLNKVLATLGNPETQADNVPVNAEDEEKAQAEKLLGCKF